MSVGTGGQPVESDSSTGASWGDVFSGVGEVAWGLGKLAWNATSAAAEVGQEIVDGEWISDVAEAAAEIGQEVADAAVAVGEVAGEILDWL
jgi:hypothetical protein